MTDIFLFAYALCFAAIGYIVANLLPAFSKKRLIETQEEMIEGLENDNEDFLFSLYRTIHESEDRQRTIDSLRRANDELPILKKKLMEKNSDLEKRHAQIAELDCLVEIRDAGIKDLQSRLDDALRQIAEYEKTQPAPVTSKPKYRLADAEVGWLCQHRNGEWSQIIDTSGSYVSGQPIRTSLQDDNGVHRNFCLSGAWASDRRAEHLDIIHTEPLAPEGTAEWAWQMRLLGNMVSHLSGILLEPESFDADDNETVYRQNWLCTQPTSGWSVYELHKKPEPQPEYRCLKCKRFVKAGATYCDRCFDKIAGIKEVTV